MAGSFVPSLVRSLLSMVLLLALSPASGSAGVGQWKSYTDMKNIRDVAADSTSVWAATSGGVFRFLPGDSLYTKLTNSEGLTSNDVTAIAIATDGSVWVGERSGAIDIYDPATGTWRYITDILLTSRTTKTIERFYQEGDKMYIATAFGISVFSISKFEFTDTYQNFATALQPDVRAVRNYGGRIVAATSGGIMMSNPGAVNLAAPESWSVSSSVTSCNSLAEFNGVLYAATGTGLLHYQSGAWTDAGAAGVYTRIVGVTASSLYFCRGAGGGSGMIASLDAGGAVTTYASFPDSATSGAVASDDAIFAGFNSIGAGLLNADRTGWTNFLPNGPYSNLFYQIAVDGNGELWAASGRDNGKGFYRYDGTTWSNYNSGTDPRIRVNECYAVNIGPANSKWISTWGGGLILVNSAGDIVKVFDHSDPGFIGVSENVDFVVPGKAAIDNNGHVWVPIFRAADLSRVVWEMRPDSTWKAYKGSPYGAASEFMFGAVTDQFNTKWFTNTVTGFTRSATIAFFNESVNVAGTADGWGTITENDGATNTIVQSVAVDRNGDVWLGTGTGITIITTPSHPTERVSQVYLGAVRDLSISCIAVDPLDNKWLGTALGVFVLSPGGDQLLAQYTVENTGGKLVDNTILSIAFDTQKGIAYIGTEKGLSSLEIQSVAPKTTLSVIDLSPNPVYLPQHSSVEIRGLVDESTIKVLTISGKVVKQFTAQGGGRAFWDCADESGHTVASGIYVIVAHDRTGSQVASAKVAVIHQ